MKAFALAALLGTPAVQAGEWALLPQPKFAGHAAAWPVPASGDMVLGVMISNDAGEPVAATPKDIAGFPGVVREKVIEETRALALRLLDEIPAREVRDARGVLEFVVIESGNPWTACVVLAPGFFDRFASTIGPDAVAAIPSQFQVIIFPRSAPPPGLADMIFNAYHATNFPVSREIFQADPSGGLRSAGTTRPGPRPD